MFELKELYCKSTDELLRTKQLDYAETGCEFDLLSNDLKRKILAHLSPKELCTMASVSKNWKELSEDNAVWNQFLKEKNTTKNTLFFNSAKFQYRNCSNPIPDLNSEIKELKIEPTETNDQRINQLFFTADIFKNLPESFIKKEFPGDFLPKGPKMKLHHHKSDKDTTRSNSVIRKDENGEEQQLGYILR